ncbi:uncharacterized protein LOC119071293 [Bradysia coprophila]|uniref:uncharacterized protein LOC119071293 n=1 Tax=Bradysia coprophila TaxID=38358 RepID=UPI00187D836E|nr:uncharacterized protein LOC119071293 [Bradysia coprophila]
MARLPPHLENWFYLLSQSWSPALRYHRKWGQKNPKQFCYWTLHGLWLNESGLGKLDYTFDPPQADFRTKLNQDPECLQRLNTVCPSLLPGQSNEQHQDRKVIKHGTCVMHYAAQDGIEELSDGKGYLCTAARLATEFNMSRYLKNTAIGKEYAVQDLISPIYDETKRVPYIHFLTNGGVNYLSEIYLFFNRHLNLISSPVRNHGWNTKVVYLGCDNNTHALQLPEHTSAAAQTDKAQPDEAQGCTCAHNTKKTLGHKQ